MLAYIFVVLAVALRLLPHPFSFTPVGASLLFFGAYAPAKRAWIPVALLAASDVYLTLFRYEYPFLWDNLVTWAWYAGIVLLGSRLRGNVRVRAVLGASVATAVSFFAVSNLAVWASLDMYPHSAAGLMMANVAGLPFFRTELVSDFLFTAVLFGIPALVNGFKEADTSRQAAI